MDSNKVTPSHPLTVFTPCITDEPLLQDEETVIDPGTVSSGSVDFVLGKNKSPCVYVIDSYLKVITNYDRNSIMSLMLTVKQ